MMEIEHPVSVPTLRQLAKTCATQGNYPVATSLNEAANEISSLRSEIVKLRGTIREIRAIANIAILRQV
jgi:hypothetical protein